MKKKRIDEISVHISLKGRGPLLCYLNTKTTSLLLHTSLSFSILGFANWQLEYVLQLPFTFTCRIELWKIENGCAVSLMIKITCQVF